MGTFKIPEISAKEAALRLTADPKVRLIDVRTDEEFSVARIEGALLVNSETAAEEVLKWPRETPLIIHCHHGVRSLSAAGFFLQHGFTDVASMAGGINAWSYDVDTSVPRY